MATTSCGHITFIFLCVFTLFVVSLALAGDDDAHARDDVALARSLRSVPRRGGRRGNERIVVDNGASGRRRGAGRRGNRGNRRNNGGGRRGGGRRGGGRGGGRGGRNRGGEGRPPFSRRDRNLIDKLTTASGQFSLAMYNLLKEDHPDLVFSPHSIHTALTMTYMGAREKTAKQMLKTLGLQRLRNNKAHMAYAALVNSLQQSGNVTLHVANAVYVKPNLPVEEAFRTDLQNMYKASFEHFDMEAPGGPEAPINAWVANLTVNKIRNLLSQGTVNDFTAMIIINAIYFKGAWQDPFDPRSTTEQTFHRAPGSTAQVQMMTQTTQYKYKMADNLRAHLVEMPYRDGRFSMYIILPLTQHGLGDVEEALSLDVLNAHLQTMEPRQVELHLPKFRTETRFSLKATLKRMRMRLPFSNRAKFDGICSTHPLKITEVIHQAVIEVSEEGTEAAAATAVIISLRSFPRQPIVVRVDHPFIYGIRDNLTQAWLFMGRFSAEE